MCPVLLAPVHQRDCSILCKSDLQSSTFKGLVLHLLKGEFLRTPPARRKGVPLRIETVGRCSLHIECKVSPEVLLSISG